MKLKSSSLGLVLCIELFLIIFHINCQSKGMEGLTKARKESALPICDIRAMRSYMLKGRKEASITEKMVLCPSITNNCCIKADLQRIYHVVNDLLPGRIMDYEEKVKSTLSRISRFHQHVVQNPPKFVGSDERRRFCMVQARNVISFPFKNFYTSMINELEIVNQEMREFHNAFYCVLCDADNHPYFEFDRITPRATFVSDYCKRVLSDKQDIIKMLNIRLVSYLVSMQNLVDCKHYIRSFNLNFFAGPQITNTVDLSKCVDFLSGRDFMRHCRRTCGRINLGKVNTIIQGDQEFLFDAVNLFERFFEFQETGNFVSQRLRTFFKNHVVKVNPPRIPQQRKLDKSQKKEKSPKLDKNPGFFEKRDKKLISTFKEIQKKEFNIMKRELKKIEKQNLEKQIKKTVKTERRLMDEGIAVNQNKDQSKNVKNFKNGSLFPSKNDKKSDFKENTLSLNENGAESKDVFMNNRLLEENKKTRSALVYVDKHKLEAYNLITLPTRRVSSRNIWRIERPPVDFDDVIKLFRSHRGINPLIHEHTKFDLPKNTFYKLVYGESRVEKSDVQLEFFLSDFTKYQLSLIHRETTMDYNIDHDDFKAPFYQQIFNIYEEQKEIDKEKIEKKLLGFDKN